MNQCFFKSRILLLATALATAGVVGAQTTNSTPAASPVTTPSGSTAPATNPTATAPIPGTIAVPGAAPAPTSSTSYAPCAGMQGTALSQCLQDSTANAAMSNRTNQLGSDTNLNAAKPSTAANGNVGATPMPKTAAAPKAASASNDQTQIASSASRNNSGAQSKTPAKANTADNKFRAELRTCVQQTGDQRESCLDRAIENRQQS